MIEKMPKNLGPLKTISAESLEIISGFLTRDDYISFDAALKINGLYTDGSNLVHIISSRRRRDLSKNGLQICFVFRDSSKIRALSPHIEKIGKVRIARPYLAWLDMLDRLRHASDWKKLAEISQAFQFNLAELTDAAITLSDAVFKRALFYLGWCGRIGSFKKLIQPLSDTPTYLDIRIDKKNLVWERNLKVFFPAEILDLKIMENPQKRYDWKYFRNSEIFIKALKRSSQLIFSLERNTELFSGLKFSEKPVTLEKLAEWLRSTRLSSTCDDFDDTDIEATGAWLKPLFADDTRRKALFRSITDCNIEELRQNIILCQTLLKLAISIRDNMLLTFMLQNFAVDIYLYGEAGLLRLAAGDADITSIKNRDTLAVLVMALLGSGRHEECNRMFIQSGLENSEEGLPLLCRACVMMILHTDPSAEILFKKAIEFFTSQDKNDLMVLSRIYLGVWFLMQQSFSQALDEFLPLIDEHAENQVPESFKGIIYANLGLVATGAGNHRQAVEILKKALPQCQKTSYSSAFAQLQYFYAWNNLLIGNFTEAIIHGQSALETVQKTGSSFIVERTFALLIFANLIFGRVEEADQWLAVLREKHEIGGKAEARLTKILQAFQAGNYAGALKLCLTEHELLCRTDVPTLLTQHAQVVAAWLLLKKNRAEAAEFINKILYLEKTKSMFHLMFYGKIFKILVCDDYEGQNDEIDFHLASAESTGRFDPYWYVIADLLAERGLKNLKNYVVRQYELSPEFLRISAEKVLSEKPDLFSFLKPCKDSGDRKFIMINASEIMNIGSSEFENLANKSLEGDFFLFDASARMILYNGQRSILRQNTMQMALLGFLLQNQARRMPLKDVFEAVWQTEFDEEFSTDAVKSVVKRLNTWSRQHSLPIRLSLVSSSSTVFICTSVDANWAGIFSLMA